MDEAQRTAILEAMADLMAERALGPGSVTIAELSARAGVSVSAFHQQFADREAALLAAFDLGVTRARETMAPAFESEERWLDAIKAGLAAFLRFLEDEPALARLTVVHAMGGGVQVLRRRAEVLAGLAAIVSRGRVETAAAKQAPPDVIGEGVVGAVLAVVHNRLVAADGDTMIELFGSLTSIVVLPYMGSSVARRELTRPVPRPLFGAHGESLGAGEPIAGPLETRLTYRTARVLRAIGDYPGASNREVAERAGVIDQGQISKLLGRLEARGLIEKIGGGRARGAPNSWRLTARGEMTRVSAAGRSVAFDEGEARRVRSDRRGGHGDRRREDPDGV